MLSGMVLAGSLLAMATSNTGESMYEDVPHQASIDTAMWCWKNDNSAREAICRELADGLMESVKLGPVIGRRRTVEVLYQDSWGNQFRQLCNRAGGGFERSISPDLEASNDR